MGSSTFFAGNQMGTFNFLLKFMFETILTNYFPVFQSNFFSESSSNSHQNLYPASDAHGPIVTSACTFMRTLLCLADLNGLSY